MIHIPPESYMGIYANNFDSDVTIGKYCSIGNWVKFLSSEHPSNFAPVVSSYPFYEKWGVDYPKCRNDQKIVIGNDVWIGEDVILIGPLEIGDGVIIGAGSVVAHDVAPYVVEFGNPSKPRKFRFNEEISNQLLKIQWWNWTEQTIRERMKDMADITSFISKYGNL